MYGGTGMPNITQPYQAVCSNVHAYKTCDDDDHDHDADDIEDVHHVLRLRRVRLQMKATALK
jgi:hypothetical protein